MIQELYINGKLMDIDDSVSITLQYKSFLFTGISDVSADRSWSVGLPKTAHNLSVIEHSNLAGSTSNFPYQSFPVEYYIDGFAVIRKGTAILTKITDKIEMFFSIGGVLDKIKQLSEVKLTELFEQTGTAMNDFTQSAQIGDWLNWNRNITMNNMSRGVGYAEFYGFTNKDDSFPEGSTNVDMPMAVQHPVITFQKILEYIERDSRFTGLNLDAIKNIQYMGSFATVLKSLEITKTTLFDSFASSLPSITLSPRDVTNDSNPSTPYQRLDSLVFVNSDNGFLRSNYADVAMSGGFRSRGFIYIDDSYKPISNKWKIKVILDIKSKHRIRIGSFISGDFNSVDYINAPDIPYTFSNGIYQYNTTVYFDFDAKTYTSWSIVLDNHYSIPMGTTYSWYDNTYANSVIISAKPIDGYSRSSTVDGFYPIIPNLPQMSCADFIMQCLQLSGNFPFLDRIDNEIINVDNSSVIYNNIIGEIFITQNDIYDVDNVIIIPEGHNIVSSLSEFSFTASISGNLHLELSSRIDIDFTEYLGQDTRYEMSFLVLINGITKLYKRRYELNILCLEEYNIFVNKGDYITIMVQSSGDIYSATTGNDITVQTSTNIKNTSKIGNPRNYQDWSNYLVKSTETISDFGDVAFTFGKYTQSNILDYKANDTNTLDSSDTLVVENTNLELKSDLVRLAFAAPQVEKLSTRMIAYPLYDMKCEDKNNFNSTITTTHTGGSNNDVVCFLQLNSSTNKYEALFPTFMQFNGDSGIKNRCYIPYQKLIRKPVFIKEKFKLQPQYLQDYDARVPIYLGQYGKFYAVMTMNIDKECNAECELLEIKEI